MGKVKQHLEQDIELNPENYNNPDPTEEEYDFINKHIIVARIPNHADKDEIENVKEDNRKDTL